MVLMYYLVKNLKYFTNTIHMKFYYFIVIFEKEVNKSKPINLFH